MSVKSKKWTHIWNAAFQVQSIQLYGHTHEIESFQSQFNQLILKFTSGYYKVFVFNVKDPKPTGQTPNEILLNMAGDFLKILPLFAMPLLNDRQFSFGLTIERLMEIVDTLGILDICCK